MHGHYQWSTVFTYYDVHNKLIITNLFSSLQGAKMISDVQLAIFANVLGVSLFLLVVLYHFVAVNNPKNKAE